MIHNEQKKWFLYSTLPPNVTKVFIYMPTINYPECEKALGELVDYFGESFNVIAKVSRIDTDNESALFVERGISVERSSFPIVVYDEQVIHHNLTDITKVVSNYLPVEDVDPNVEERLKALKDGKDLL